MKGPPLLRTVGEVPIRTGSERMDREVPGPDVRLIRLAPDKADLCFDHVPEG